MLHVALSTILRQTQMLSSESAIQHQRTHEPSTYGPWIFGKHEGWKRLATSAVKLDRYIAILYNQPAFISAEELNLQLTCSYATWNAHGLHELYPRSRRELMQRETWRMSQLMNLTDTSSLSFPLFAEDVELILMGTANDVWTYRRQLAAPTPADLGSQRIKIMVQLDLCKHQLNRMYSIQNFPKNHTAELEVMLTAYYGREEEGTSPVLLTEAMRRFSQATFNAAMLYNLLELHLSTDVQQLIDVQSGIYDDNELYADIVLQKQIRVAEWAVGMDGRSAAIRALLILRLYEEFVRHAGVANAKCVDPIVYVALLAASVVARAWTERTVVQGCVCGETMLPMLEVGGMPGLADEESPAFASWKATGGKLQYNGVALCACNLGSWRERFARGLPEGGWRQRLDRNWPVM